MPVKRDHVHDAPCGCREYDNGTQPRPCNYHQGFEDGAEFARGEYVRIGDDLNIKVKGKRYKFYAKEA